VASRQKNVGRIRQIYATVIPPGTPSGRGTSGPEYLSLTSSSMKIFG